MVKRSTWWATAVGTAVGTGGWLLGIGKYVSSAHPGWALFGITLAATIITQITVEREVRHRIARAQAAQSSSPPRDQQL
jgi:cysteine synthase